MKKEYCALSFSEKERICEEIFTANGPYWHLYTDGTNMQDIFCTEQDFDTGMWILAGAASTANAKLITFELMSNHVHFILSGKEESCHALFNSFKSRLKRIMQKRGRAINWKEFNAYTLPIASLKSLRNEIIYTNRNAYVANRKYTPDSYPWGGGCAFFNAWLKDLPIRNFDELTIDKRRELIHSRDISDYSGLKVVCDKVFIPSFCDIQLGESLFTDPRMYFSLLTRNSESFSMIAERLHDSLFLTDEELFSIITTYISSEYNIQRISLLSPKQKIECAKHLKTKYNATRQQIRRILRIEDSILSELFP